MALDTAILQGRFTSTGTTRTIPLRSDVDWMRVINLTEASAQNDVGVEFFWQRGFATGTGLRYFKSGGADTLNLLNLAAPLGFTLVDTSGSPLITANVLTTGSTNATQPVISTASTAGLTAGDIVRLSNDTGQPNLQGVDFQIDTIVNNVSFRIANTLANVPGAVGAGAASAYRKIHFDPIYYPRNRVIANITQAASAVVTTTVDHGLTVGQEVRFHVTADFEMIEMDNLSGTVTAVTSFVDSVSEATFTVDIDSSGFTAFVWVSATAFSATTFASVVPFGIDTGFAIASNVDLLADATENRALLGIQLSGGSDSPGGAVDDVMYWRAGKSFSVDNQ